MKYNAVMPERVEERINAIIDGFSGLAVSKEFSARVREGRLTRDENSQSHFVVYFAAYDPESKKVFIGHHKKSGMWLFNGGHIDKGETPEEALVREVREEWGVEIDLQSVGEPRLLTVTPIENQRIRCTRHYDFWYLVPVSKESFAPDKEKLDTEFYEMGWKGVGEARRLITDLNTLKVISEFERLFIKP